MASTFESFAIVEVMGHKQYAGYVTEQTIGGVSFVRVDVAEENGLPGFTKLLGAGAIYAITPCTEETARAFARQTGERAFALYEAPRLPGPSVMADSDESEGDECYD